MVEKKFIHQASSQVWTHSKSTTIHQITNRTIVANEINCSTVNDEVLFLLIIKYDIIIYLNNWSSLFILGSSTSTRKETNN